MPPVLPALPSLPGLRDSLGAAGTDFYYNSWRLVPANIVWGAGVVCLLVGAGVTPFAFALMPLLAVPTVGIHRLAAIIARGRPASLSDAFDGMRRKGRSALLVGVAFSAGAFVLGTNIVSGVATAEPAGLALATLGGWGLVAAIVLGAVLWPILADPLADDRSLPEAIRLAVTLVLVYPVRFAILGFVVALILVASTIAFAAIVTISVSFVALVSARQVLPAADRLEATHAGEAKLHRDTDSG